MKKRVNRWLVMVAAVCALLLFPVMTGYAADGTLMLSDPTGGVGEEIAMTMRVDGGGQPIGDVTATLTYDPAMLEFVSGTNIEGGEGTLTLTASGTGAETEMVFNLLFRGLAEGETKVQVTQSTAYLFSDETLNLAAGEATVTVGAGNGTGGATTEPTERVTGQESIEIDGQYYAIYENFTDALIPFGFSRTTAQYAGTEHSAIRQDASGKVIFFLVAGDSDPIMAVYNESDSTFIRAERVDVSDSFYIMVLASGDSSSLPEEFYETTLSLHEVNFPAWQNMESMDFYLIYALSSGGTEGFYQYDSVDSTYQRYVPSSGSAPAEEPEEKTDDSIIGKIESIISDNLIIVAGAAAAVLLILFIIIIVLSVKLGRRNAELDDIYAGDEDDDGPKVRKSSRQQFVGYDDDDDDGEDDFMDDDYEDDNYHDDGYDDDGYDDEYYDDDEYDDYDDEDDMKEYTPGKSSSGKEDSYDDIDFIDV